MLTFFVIRYGWKYPLWLCIAATGFFFVIDVTFFASNLLKLIDGGWFPLRHRHRHVHADDDLEERPPSCVSERLRDEAIDLRRLPRGGVRQPADAGRRHGGVPERRELG